MATFGYSATPTAGNIYNASNNLAASYVGAFPSPGGYVTKISVYVGGYTTGGAAYLCLWDGGGNLLTAQGGVTIPTSPAWMSYTIAGQGFYVASGTGLFIGTQLNPADQGLYVNYDSNGAYKWDFGVNGTAYPGTIGTHTQYTSQAIGAYITYTSLTTPTISGTSPTVAVPGQSLTITGTGFLHASGATIGGVAVDSFTVNSDTQITCTVDASTAGGTQTLAVTNPAGTGNYTLTVGGVIRIWNGSAWGQAVVKVRNGSAWVVASGVKVWNGSAWVEAS